MRKYAIIPALFALALCLTACGEKSYADGSYQGRSADYINEEEGEEAGNGYGVVNLTISGGQITACEYKTYELDGTLKDEEYGKEGGRIANKDYYNKAQKANAACAEYASMLVQNGQLDGIDSISGATINYNEFKEAVELALKEAQE